MLEGNDEIEREFVQAMVEGAEQHRKQHLRWQAFYIAAATNTGKIPE